MKYEKTEWIHEITYKDGSKETVKMINETLCVPTNYPNWFEKHSEGHGYEMKSSSMKDIMDSYKEFINNLGY